MNDSIGPESSKYRRIQFGAEIKQLKWTNSSFHMEWKIENPNEFLQNPWSLPKKLFENNQIIQQNPTLFSKSWLNIDSSVGSMWVIRNRITTSKKQLQLNIWNWIPHYFIIFKLTIIFCLLHSALVFNGMFLL